MARGAGASEAPGGAQACWNRSIVLPPSHCYFGSMHPVRPQSPHLPTTLSFAALDDRTRLPGRFFYRLIARIGLLG
jgi:hypothetical protein